MMLAALLVIPVLIVEQSEIGDPWATMAAVTNWVIWSAFLAEVLIMLAVVSDRAAWVRRHPIELAIVVLTPPFAPALLQGLRGFRLLRLVRLLVLIRAVGSARRLFSLDGLRWATVIWLIMILGGGAAFTAVEKNQALTTWDGVWWALTTATTVGYGDLYPETTYGRLIAVVVMVGGIGLVALVTGAIAERFLRVDVEALSSELDADDAAIEAELRDVQARLRSLEELLRRRDGR